MIKDAEDGCDEKQLSEFCKRRHEKNATSTKYCNRCGTPLNQVMLSDAYGSRTSELLNAPYQDPEVKELLARKVVERGLVNRLGVGGYRVWPRLPSTSGGAGFGRPAGGIGLKPSPIYYIVVN